jgi:L-amino acid N-acyltransferase YncA
MANLSSPIRIREARPDDAVTLCEILNAIIRIGGTTALETPLDVAQFQEAFLVGPCFITCFVAEDEEAGRLWGFQALGHYPELPPGWADIATFARVEPKLRGVGTALFGATRVRSRELGLTAINAAIRADNASGLAYYAKMGFEDYGALRDVPLEDGTPVDRILKRYLVNGPQAGSAA